MSEDRIQRDRLASLADLVERIESPASEGSEAQLVRTKTVGTYPTTATAFYACSPVLIDGNESEGSTASLAADSSRTVHAYNLGTKIPPSGTDVIVHSVGGRWAFRYDG